MHCIGDFERISDHAINIMEIARGMQEKKEQFSESATTELHKFSDALKEIMSISLVAFETGDIELAEKVEPLEEVIDYLHAKVKRHHVKRLQSGNCTIELGLDLEDLITNYERTADHCSNIAVSLIQIQKDEFETHEYLEEYRKDSKFESMFKEYKEKYRI